MTILRPYQQAAFDNVRRACVDLRREAPDRPAEVLLVAPTGAGKTAIGCEFLAGAVRKGARALWLAHRTELVDQAVARLAASGIRAGVVMAGRRGRADEPIQVASVPTLVAREAAPEADLLVFDEAHHVAAESWRAVADAYPRARAILGLTATPERSDGAALSPPFRRLVVACQIGELVREGWLLPCDVESPPGPKPRKAAEGLAQHPVDAYEQWAKGERAVCFSFLVEEAEEWAAEARRRGIEARAVHGGTPAAERRETLDGLHDGRIKLVTNPMVLTEGWDCPPCSVAIVARGCSAPGLWLQMVGRVLRPSEGRAKPGERARVVDLRGHIWAHGHPEEDRVYSLSGRGIRRKSEVWQCESCGAANELKAETCTDCGEERPRRGKVQPQGVGEAKLGRASKEAVAAMWRDKMRAWKGILAEHGPAQAPMVFEQIFGHRVPKTFPRTLKGAA